MAVILLKLYRKWIALLCVGIAILAVGFVLGEYFKRGALKVEECRGQYQYINADVVCGSPDIIRKTGYIQTRDKIDDFIKQERGAGRLSTAAVYFRDLAHGPVFGINELADFAPASLLKLPLAFVFLNLAEDHPDLLSTTIQYDGNISVDAQNFKPRQTAEPNRAYTIKELLEMMLVYSDNASYELLELYLTKTPDRARLRINTFQELGLINPTDRIEETITVRGYTSLFRILYNVSYLNAGLSEKLLDWLAKSDFISGLVGGVPEGVTVAHKFGERPFDDGKKQLHDCGIIYYPGNPYVLCVMTQGDNWAALEPAISRISEMVYKEVDSRRLQAP